MRDVPTSVILALGIIALGCALLPILLMQATLTP